MKQLTNFILIAVVTFTTMPLQAAAETRLGIKAGLTSASQRHRMDASHPFISNDLKSDYKTAGRNGLALGLAAEFSFSPFFALRADASYLQKGDPASYRVDYLSLVFAAKLSADSDMLKIYFFGGPRLDIKLGLKPDAPVDSYKLAVSGLTIGTGAEFHTWTWGSLLLEIRYDYDLGLAAENKSYFYDSDGRLITEVSYTVKNGSFFVVTGVMF